MAYNSALVMLTTSPIVHAFVDGAYLRERANELAMDWPNPYRVALWALVMDIKEAPRGRAGRGSIDVVARHVL